MHQLSKRGNSGQALLIILLVMAVVLTIGLSVVSRSITDIKISEQTEDAARAFSAAEAGIENALAGNSLKSFQVGSSTVNIDFQPVGGEYFIYPHQITKDEVATVWLADYNKDSGVFSPVYSANKIMVAWGNQETSSRSDDTPALEFTLYYKEGNDYKIKKYLLDPNDDRGNSNSFCIPGSSEKCDGISNFITTGGTGALFGGQNLQFSADLALPQGSNLILLFVRIRILYASIGHWVGVVGTEDFPSQGDKIAAIGQSGSATRRVEVYRLKPAPPEVFDFSLYSGGNLTK